MSRSLAISIPARKTDKLVEELQHTDGVVSINLNRGTSLKPPGDALTVATTNEGLHKVLQVLSRHGVGEEGTVVSSEPRSLVSPADEEQIDEETNEGVWPEITSLLRRDTNISSNYIMAMVFAGIVAAAGLWSDTLHIIIGAMVIAPGFEPIIRMPFGLIGKDYRTFRLGATSTGVGYAAMVLGAAAATLIATAVSSSSIDLGDRHWVQYWTSAQPLSIVISLSAGAAGAAILAAQRAVLTTGVMIALALIPAASITGMALVMGEPGLAGKALLRWVLDAICVILAGGVVFLFKRRIRHQGETLPQGR